MCGGGIECCMEGGLGGVRRCWGRCLCDAKYEGVYGERMYMCEIRCESGVRDEGV